MNIMDIDFSQLFDTINDGITTLARETVEEYSTEVTELLQSSTNNIKSDVEEWAKLYKSGELKQSDLEFLIKGRKELFEMKAIQKLAIANIQLDKLKNGITSLIVNSITTIV